MGVRRPGGPGAPTHGRLAVHIISGGSDADQARDGDYLPHNGMSIPVYGDGASHASVSMLGPVVDSFMIWGEPLADAATFFERVQPRCQRSMIRHGWQDGP